MKTTLVHEGIRIEMDAGDAHDMACYFYWLTAKASPRDAAKDDMLAILRAAHDQGVCSHDCPEPR